MSCCRCDILCWRKLGIVEGEIFLYLKRIHNVNVGPIEDAEIIFPFDEKNNPKPVVIVGENGMGKSVLLSNIVDSFYEFAGKAFSDAVKKADFGLGSAYYKIVTGQEIHYGKKFMYSWIEYEDKNSNDKKATYLFRNGDFNFEKFCKRENITDKKYLFSDEELKKFFIDKKQAEKLFIENAICYFPPNRYEKPNWMGKDYYDISESEHPSVKEKISGRLDKPILVENVTARTLQWLLDVIADSRADVKLEGHVLNIDDQRTNVQDLPVLGKARKNLESIMSTILDKNIYFGLNYRNSGSSRFNVNSIENGNLVALSLDALSTGQSALFNMFATIIRYAEMDNLNKSVELEKIKGIVVIDEVELHLHTNLQRKVLPKLLHMFPKVQFVISSHSPLFLLGMDEFYDKDGYEIYQMPRGRKTSSEGFSEFEKAYNYLAETERHQQDIQNAIEQHSGKTLIITEGSTDWKHMKAAYESLADTLSEYKDMDFEFLEYEPDNSNKNEYIKLDMGKDKLKSTCEQCSKLRRDLKLRRASKLIFIADRDDEKIKKSLGKEDEPYYRNWDNNVFSFVLPVPPHRKDTPIICIEHYYTDEEIKTPTCINGIERRLYMGNEFHKNKVSLDQKLICLDKNSCGKDSIKIIDGSSNRQVYDINDDECEKNLALTKMDFAENILYRVAGFDKMNFDNFRLIFDVVKKILDEPLV